MSKGKWGKVVIESYRDKLRIRVPASLIGKVQYIYSGLDDTEHNRFIVDTTIKKIELDLRLEEYTKGSFDTTLEKYSFKKPKVENTFIVYDLATLWEKYTEYKANFLSPSTIKRDYNMIAKRVDKLELELRSLKDIENILLKEYSPETTRRTIQQLNACFNWCVDNGLLKDNVLLNKKRIPKKENHVLRKHFLSTEVIKILTGFEEKTHSSYYTNFVKFLFYTGCRLEEAVILTWDKVFTDRIQIDEAQPCDTKLRDKTKTKVTRALPLTKELINILELQKVVKDSSNLIFPSKKGFPLNYSNLGTKHWNPIISNLFEEEKIGVKLSLNHTRHTFINHCLTKGVSINQIAYWVGNSPKTIISNYASVIHDEQIPDLYED